MRLWFSPPSSGRLQEFARTGEDPLGIALETGAAGGLEETIASAIQDLGDRRDAVLASLVRWKAVDPSSIALDLFTARLIAHEGFEPLAVAWLCATHGWRGTISDTTSAVVSAHRVRVHGPEGATADAWPHGRTSVRLGRQVRWWDGGYVEVRGLPDTISLAATGRRLAAIVSHPVLDKLHRVVTGSSPSPTDPAGTLLKVAFGRVLATPDELAAMRPVRSAEASARR